MVAPSCCIYANNSVGALFPSRREQSDCYATKLKRTQCSCRAVFHKSMDDAGAMRRIKATPDRVQREKDELDLQVRDRQD